MVERRQLVEISPSTETKWWEAPMVPIRGKRIRLARLRRTLEFHILPVLQHLESFYLRKNFGATPRLYGKSFVRVEKDDIAIEAALYLFDLAVEEKLITFGSQQEKYNRILEETAVGACGLSIVQIKKRYIKRAVSLISKKTGMGNSFLKNIPVVNIGALKKVRMLAKFGAANIHELSDGLGHNLQSLIARDEEYLQTLHRCCELKYLRAIRHALGDGFPQILKWRTPFVRAIADNFTHRAQVMAMGRSLNQQPAQEVVLALSGWPMGALPEDDSVHTGLIDIKKTRIGQIRGLLGKDFDTLLTWNGETVSAIGHWQDREIKILHPYIKYLTPDVMEYLGKFPPRQMLEILHGLWSKLGKTFFESALRQQNGLVVIKNITKAIHTMNKRQSVPDNLAQAIISSGIFDIHMASYIKIQP